jgi:hypothetical protein
MPNIERRITRAEQRTRSSDKCSICVLFRPYEGEADSEHERFEQEYEAAVTAGKQVMVLSFAKLRSQHEPV